MRNTDRLITPAVVVTFLIVGGVCVALTVAAVAYLTARGLDPDPMLKLIGALVAAVSSTGTLVLQLANNSRTAKTEKNTGQQANQIGVLADAVYTVADALPRPVPRHSASPTAPYTEAAPAPRGS